MDFGYALDCGTGFSRESVGGHSAIFVANALASSRLKPVPLKKRRVCPMDFGPALDCGTGFSREGVGSHSARFVVSTLASSRLKPVALNGVVCSQ